MTFRLYEPAHWRQMGDNGPLFLSKARAHITQNLIFHFNVACSLQIVLLFNDIIFLNCFQTRSFYRFHFVGKTTKEWLNDDKIDE